MKERIEKEKKRKTGKKEGKKQNNTKTDSIQQATLVFNNKKEQERTKELKQILVVSLSV